MAKEIELLDIVSSIYDTVLNPDAWMIAGEKIRQRYHSTYAGLYVYDVRSSAMVHDATFGTDEIFVNAYINTFCFMDPYRDTETVVADNSHLPLTDAVFDDFFDLENEHKKYPYFAEYWHKHDSYHAIGALANLPGHLRAEICAPRNKSIGAYTTAEKKDFEYIRQAFHQSMRISQHIQQLGHDALALEQTIDLIEQVVFIVDQYGRIISSNQAASQHLQHGTILKNSNGKLQSHNRKLNQELSNTIAKVCNQSMNSGSLSRQFKYKPFEILIYPIKKSKSEFSLGGTRAAVFLFENQVTSAEALSQIYQLSPIETEVLKLVLLNQSRNQIANHRNTSQETVKSQLHSIYLKTGLKNMAELKSAVVNSSFNCSNFIQ